MIWEIGSTAKHLLLPPMLWGWLLLYGLLMFRRKPGRARWAIGIATFLLYAGSTALVSGSLMNLVADTPPRLTAAAQAVVVLGGGRSVEWDAAGKLVRARLGPATGERVIEGVRLARERQLPILVTGGKADRIDPAEALVMRDVMLSEFGMAARWVEAESRNTVENARFSALLLQRDGISRVILVTNGYHMRRARYLFESAGLQVIPASVDPRYRPAFAWNRLPRELLPNAAALHSTYLATNEIGGLLYAWLSVQWASAASTAAVTSASTAAVTLTSTAAATPTAAVAN